MDVKGLTRVDHGTSSYAQRIVLLGFIGFIGLLGLLESIGFVEFVELLNFLFISLESLNARI